MASVALSSSLLAMQFSAPDWPFRRPVSVDQPNHYYQLKIPAELAANAQPTLEDLRLIAGGNEVPYRIRELPDSDVMATLETPELIRDPDQHTSAVAADLGRALAFNRVDMVVGDRQFERNAQVEISTDTGEWKIVARGVVRRTRAGEPVALRFAEQDSRFFRVTFFDGKEAPLDIRSVNLRESRRVMEFISRGAGNYWLYYGAPRASAPEYSVSEMDGKVAPAEATAGKEERNAAYASRPVAAQRAPFTVGRYVLTMLMVLTGMVVVLLVGWFTVLRFLGKSRKKRRRSSYREGDGATESLLSVNLAVGRSTRLRTGRGPRRERTG